MCAWLWPVFISYTSAKYSILRSQGLKTLNSKKFLKEFSVPINNKMLDGKLFQMFKTMLHKNVHTDYVKNPSSCLVCNYVRVPSCSSRFIQHE